MNQTATMIDVDQISQAFNKERSELREDLKKKVQEWVDNGELDYDGAIRIFEASRYFETSPFIIEDGIFEQYNDYIADWGEKCRTIYFSDVLDWINDSEGEAQEAYDAAGGGNPFEEIYKYAIDTNIISYVYDW